MCFIWTANTRSFNVFYHSASFQVNFFSSKNTLWSLPSCGQRIQKTLVWTPSRLVNSPGHLTSDLPASQSVRRLLHMEEAGQVTIWSATPRSPRIWQRDEGVCVDTRQCGYCVVVGGGWFVAEWRLTRKWLVLSNSWLNPTILRIDWFWMKLPVVRVKLWLLHIGLLLVVWLKQYLNFTFFNNNNNCYEMWFYKKTLS